MKRLTITLAAIVAALVPAAAGLWGNASFSQAVPVRVPASAQVVTPSLSSTSSTPSASRSTEAGDDHGGRTPSASRTTEAGDDHGGQTPRDQRTEPGDDRGGSSSGSNSGSNSGSGSTSGSGSGSDDSRSDDHCGHGSDG
jgi:hypothetical protein